MRIICIITAESIILAGIKLAIPMSRESLREKALSTLFHIFHCFSYPQIASWSVIQENKIFHSFESGFKSRITNETNLCISENSAIHPIAQRI